ncbi:PHA/PHB synthase family protein [Bordetella genomosp. 9]|nr:alpha/beta fold hydrolase [Bordetella genomosp. 9]
MSKRAATPNDASPAGAAAGAPMPPPTAAPSAPSCAPASSEPPWRGWDRLSHAAVARASGGVSPLAVCLDWADWAMHLAISPGKQLSLLQTALQAGPDGAAPAANGRRRPDPRFDHPDWNRWPYTLWRSAFQRAEACWDAATQDVSGAAPHHQRVVNFMGRQWLDTLSPSNFWFANPEVLEAIAETRGFNLLQGARRFYGDACDTAAGCAPGASASRRDVYRVGREVAATPGAVVYRNQLFELILYAPATPQTWREPVLIVPSWLLKYYILDLSEHNSLVRYLVQSGHTVYAISWKNPHEEARDWGMDRYLRDGLFTALEQVSQACGGRRVHGVGYCLGGTLLAAGAAALARRERRPGLRSLTLLTTQTDFDEPGELGLFISPGGVACLDALMWQQGYLDGRQLAGVFQLLNSRDLIWSRLVRDYLLGRQRPISDLMAWNADTTRLPYRLHSETLRWLYLNNDLAAGRLCVEGEPVALADIRVPMLAVATERDHISPWQSVYKLHLLNHRDLTFVLCSGGHNVGIVSEPGRPNRHFRSALRHQGDPYLPPSEWLARTPVVEGSWWPHWEAWLCRHSGQKGPPPDYPPETALCAAPGRYVMEQ